MKVYTKTGDSGETSLYDGCRIQKSAINFMVLGEIDELSSRIGLLCAMINNDSEMKDDSIDNYSLLRKIQRILQDFNTHIATIDRVNRRLPELSDDYVTELENAIDMIENKNTKLTNFILPGVTPIDAQSHLCRTQTRKVERVLIELHNSKDILNVKTTRLGKQSYVDLEKFIIPEVMLKYINRLSDFFFVLARYLSRQQDIFYT